MHESGVARDIADNLVAIGEKIRRLKGHGPEEGAPTRMLVYAGMLIAKGIPAVQACSRAVGHWYGVRFVFHANGHSIARRQSRLYRRSGYVFDAARCCLRLVAAQAVGYGSQHFFCDGRRWRIGDSHAG